MADHIPFVSGEDECGFVNGVYPDSEVVRVPLDRIQKLQPLLKGRRLWIDPAFEGFHHEIKHRQEKWTDYIVQFVHHACFDNPAFLSKPVQQQVNEFVEAMLNRAASHQPTWLTIPQFPVGKKEPKNKINWALVEATVRWREKSNYKGKLILPFVVTNQNQISGKTARNKHVAFIKKCFEQTKQKIDGFWWVDSTLADQTGTDNFRDVRFRALINMCNELDAVLSERIFKISGPYWGMNLVLWAKANINYPAISLGRSYQYRIIGLKVTNQASVRLPLPPLRRWVSVTPDLEEWLDQVVGMLAPNDPACTEFAQQLKSYGVISNDPAARLEVVRFYKHWFDSISAHPKAGRALALYQDLSSAYVLGKALPELPKSENTARNPARVAEQLMFNCL